jgi:hypothetical protein
VDIRKRLSLVVSIAAVLGLLLAGTFVGRHSPSRVLATQPSLVPSADLSSDAARIWACPGPLQLGSGSGAEISIVNPGLRDVVAAVLIAETKGGEISPAASDSASRTLSVMVPRDSDREVPVSAARASGRLATVDAAVSVTVSGGAVAVFETESHGSAQFQQACSDGVAPIGYLAEGMTAGASQVQVALFDPVSTAAVANVTVGTSLGPVMPEQLQGVVVPGRSLVVFDLARYVPQRSVVAVAVGTHVGELSVGASWSVDARFSTTIRGIAERYRESGTGMEVGLGRPLANWAMPLGAVGPDANEALRIFNPQSRPASLTLRAAVAGGASASLAVTVAPGTAVSLAAPEPPEPSGGEGLRSHRDRASDVESAALLTVTSAHNLGVIVERETYVSSPRLVTVGYLAPLSEPVRQSVASIPVSSSLGHSDSFEIWNLSGRVATVVITSLTPALRAGSGPLSPVAPRTETIPAASAITVPAMSPGGSSPPGGGFVFRADEDISVTTQFAGSSLFVDSVAISG